MVCFYAGFCEAMIQFGPVDTSLGFFPTVPEHVIAQEERNEARWE